MPSYTGEVVSPRSVEDAFAYLAAFEHVAEWDPNCDRAERLTQEDVEVGTRFRLVFNPVGSLEFELEYAVRELDAPRRVVLEGGNARLRSIDTITVESWQGAGSKVVYTAELSGVGALKAADPLLGLALQRAGKGAREGLRERLA